MRMWIKKRRKKRYYLISIILLIVILFYVFIERTEPIFKLRAADTAAQAGKDLIDSVLIEVLRDGEYFDEKKSDEISLYDIDTYELNTLRNDMSKALSDKIRENYYTTVYISFGSLFNNAVLQGMGPRIPVRIYFGSVSKVDLKDEFISAGINQTKYKASLDIKLSVSVISYLFSETKDININIPVSERILVGSVPSYYIQGKG